MTNEEFTEEILFEAHTEGFIDELRTYINNLPIIDQKGGEVGTTAATVTSTGKIIKIYNR